MLPHGRYVYGLFNRRGSPLSVLLRLANAISITRAYRILPFFQFNQAERSPPYSTLLYPTAAMVQSSAAKDKWSAQHYNTGASFVYSKAYAAPILGLLNAQPGEKIYDFGCGSGDLTVQIAEAVGPTGQAVGVDFSASMVRCDAPF